MTPKGEAVPRPVKASDYTIVFATTQAQRGWRDVVATQRNAVVQAWDRLTIDPSSIDATCHPLKGELATVGRDGTIHDQWQYELKNGARLWFYVEGRIVHLIAAYTSHPHQTK